MVKYASEEERKEAVREQKRTSAKRIREAKKMEGGAVVQNVKDAVSNRIAKWKQVLSGNITQFSPKIQRIIKKYGDKRIVGATVKRNPVGSLLTGALSFFSMGKFGKRMERDFDDLFHLYLELKLEGGTRITIEKNERIAVSVNDKTRPKTESENVPLNDTALTLNELIAKTKERMGSKFFPYSAAHNNCQDFISNVLSANKIGNAANQKFVKQDTKKLFKDLPYLRKLSNTLTDIGARADVAMQGGMMPHIIPADDSDEDNQAYTTPPNEAVGFQPVPPAQQEAYNQLREISLTVPTEETYQAFRTIANQHTRLVEHLENAMNQLPGAGGLRQTYDAYRQHYAGRWTDAHHVGVEGTGFSGEGSAAGGGKPPNRWVTFVREWSKKKKVTYMCAVSKPQLRVDYYKKYPKTGKAAPEKKADNYEELIAKKKRLYKDLMDKTEDEEKKIDPGHTEAKKMARDKQKELEKEYKKIERFGAFPPFVAKEWDREKEGAELAIRGFVYGGGAGTQDSERRRKQDPDRFSQHLDEDYYGKYGKDKFFKRRSEGKGLGETIRDGFFGTGFSSNDDPIDWDSLDWGSFTKQFKRFSQQHPHTKVKDLGDFARMILQNKDKFSAKTEKRANFYKNVIEKKNISGKGIAMPKKLTQKQLKAIEEEMEGEGLYVGSGIYSGQGFMAGSGCPQCGMMEGGAMEISHPILDEISGGNIFGDAGRWFKKAGRTINRKVIKPAAKWTKKAVKDIDRSVIKPIDLAFSKDQALDKAFSKGGVMDKTGRTIFRETIPVLTGALAGAAGAAATGGVGGLAAGYAGGKAGEELVRMSGVGVKKGGARKGQPAGSRLAYDDVPRRRGRFAKGSQEAKDYMAELRSRKK